MRHNMSGAPHLIAPLVSASVINAGDGMDEHPTQALLDMLTIKEKKGGFKGLKVAIIGDIYHSRAREECLHHKALQMCCRRSYNAYASGNGKTWSKSI